MRFPKLSGIKDSCGYSVLLCLALSFAVSPASAYNISLKSGGRINLDNSLQDYEESTLAAVSRKLKDVKAPDNSGFRFEFDESGKLKEVVFLAPRPEDAVQKDIKDKLQGFVAGPVPGTVTDSTLTLEIDFKELTSDNFKRRRISVGGGHGGRSIRGVGGSVYISGMGSSHRRAGTEAQTPGGTSSGQKRKTTPYSGEDRSFESKLKRLYEEIDIPEFSDRDRASGGEELDVDQLTTLAADRKKRGLTYAAATIYALQAERYLRKGEKVKAGESLELATGLASELSKQEKNAFVYILIGLARRTTMPSIIPSDRSSSYRIFVDGAQKLAGSGSDIDPAVKLLLAESKYSLQSVNSGRDEMIAQRRKILNLVLEQSPVDERQVLRAYRQLAELLTKEEELPEASTILNQAMDYLQKNFPGDSLARIPVLLSKMKVAEAQSLSDKSTGEIVEMVENYAPNFTPTRFAGRNSYANAALGALRGYLYAFRSQKPSGSSRVRKENREKIARAYYLLLLKVNGYNQSAFQSLAEVLKEEGKEEQLVGLYKETIAFLSDSPNKRYQRSAELLRKYYSHELLAQGKESEAARQSKILSKAEKAQSESRISLNKNKLSELEKMKNPKPWQFVGRRVSLCLAYIESGELSDLGNQMTAIEKVLQSEEVSNAPAGSSELYTVNKLLKEVVELDGADKYLPVLKGIIRNFDANTNHGISLNPFMGARPSSKNQKLKDELGDYIYEVRLKRFNDKREFDLRWLPSMVRFAEDKKRYADASRFQERYLTTIASNVPGSESREMKGEFELARLLLLAGEKKKGVKAYEEAAAAFMKIDSDGWHRAFVSPLLARLSEDFTRLSLLDQADDALLKAFSSARTTRGFLPGSSDYESAIDALVKKYMETRKFEKIPTLYAAIIKELPPNLSSGYRLRLARELLKVSLADKAKSETWIKSAEKSFDGAIESIASTSGKSSYNYKKAIRDWVEVLDKSGYEDEAKAREKLLL